MQGTMPNFNLQQARAAIHAPPAAPAISTPPAPVPEQTQPAGPDVPLPDGMCVNDALRYVEKNPLIFYGTLLLLGSWLVIRFR